MILKALKALARDCRIGLSYTYCRLCRSGLKKDGLQSGSSVAIVRPDLIGDFVLATPFLHHVRSLYPRSRITLVGNESWRELALWLNDNPIVSGKAGMFDEFDGIRPALLTRFREFSRTARQLAAFDTIVYFTCSRTNSVDKLVALAGGETIGCAGNNANIARLQNRRNQRRYDILIPNPESILELARNADFIASLAEVVGTSAPIAVEPSPPRWTIPADLMEESLSDLAVREQIDLHAPVVAVSPFSSVVLKDWPLTSYAFLIARIHETHPELQVVVLGGQDDAARPMPFPHADWLVDLRGRTSLVELVNLIARAWLSVSGDTAAAHIASAVGTHNVTVLGGGQYGRFFPYPSPFDGVENVTVAHEMRCYQCNWFCKFRLWRDAPAPCVSRIPVDAVHEQVAGLL